MKTRQEFLEDFFTRLRQAGFRVEPLPDGDLAVEVYAGNSLLCVVTRDGGSSMKPMTAITHGR